MFESTEAGSITVHYDEHCKAIDASTSKLKDFLLPEKGKKPGLRLEQVPLIHLSCQGVSADFDGGDLPCDTLRLRST